MALKSFFLDDQLGCTCIGPQQPSFRSMRCMIASSGGAAWGCSLPRQVIHLYGPARMAARYPKRRQRAAGARQQRAPQRPIGAARASPDDHARRHRAEKPGAARARRAPAGAPRRLAINPPSAYSSSLPTAGSAPGARRRSPVSPPAARGGGWPRLDRRPAAESLAHVPAVLHALEGGDVQCSGPTPPGRTQPPAEAVDAAVFTGS
jgi:hypothetical protein